MKNTKDNREASWKITCDTHDLSCAGRQVYELISPAKTHVDGFVERLSRKKQNAGRVFLPFVYGVSEIRLRASASERKGSCRSHVEAVEI